MPVRTYAQLIEGLTAQKQYLSTYQTEVGATAADITDVEEELQNMQAIQAYAENATGFKEMVSDNKQVAYNGDQNLAIPDWPALAVLVLPFPAKKQGGLSRYNERARRWRTGPGYTPEIGEILKIRSESPAPPDPATVQPTIKLEPAQTDFEFAIIIGNRGEAKMWEGFARVAGTPDWTSLGRYEGKSANATFANPAGDGPVQIEVRARGIKSNEPYGLFSEISQVTLNP